MRLERAAQEQIHSVHGAMRKPFYGCLVRRSPGVSSQSADLFGSLRDERGCSPLMVCEGAPQE